MVDYNNLTSVSGSWFAPGPAATYFEISLTNNKMTSVTYGGNKFTINKFGTGVIGKYHFDYNNFATFDPAWFIGDKPDSSEDLAITFKYNQITKIEANPLGWATLPMKLTLDFEYTPFTVLRQADLTPMIDQNKAAKSTGGGLGGLRFGNIGKKMHFRIFVIGVYFIFTLSTFFRSYVGLYGE